MNPARLNERIQVQKRTVTKNSFGAESESWSDLFYLWATVQYKGGVEEFSRGVQNNYLVDFVIRYSSKVDYDCRIVWDNETYQIQQIEKIGRKEALRIRCNRV